MRQRLTEPAVARGVSLTDSIELLNRFGRRLTSTLQASRGLFSYFQHAEDVESRESLHLIISPSAMGELRKKRGIRRDILETLDRRSDSIEVTADADVSRTCNLLDVVE